MFATQKVLVPVDLSLSHRALTATTRKLFDRRNCEIVMLHVIEDQPRTGRGLDIERAMAQMEFLARKEFDYAPVRRRVERGRAADCILDYARLHRVDSIVMPAGGVSSLARGSLGHVSQEVLEGANCAVWMEWMTGATECARHVCCAVRFDESDEAVLRRAREVAGELDAELSIVHAVSYEPRSRSLEHELQLARACVDRLREKFAPEASLHVEIGDVSTVVCRALYRLDAGLLVAGGQGEAIVAAEMACPVLRVAAATAHAVGRTA